MDDETRYDKLMNEILRQTRDGEIRWRPVDRSQFAADVLNGKYIFKSFASENYARGDEPYVLGYIEMKDIYTDEIVDISRPELLIYKEGKLILTISGYHLADGLLDRLGSLVSDQNEEAKSFLSTF